MTSHPLPVLQVLAQYLELKGNAAFAGSQDCSLSGFTVGSMHGTVCTDNHFYNSCPINNMDVYKCHNVGMSMIEQGGMTYRVDVKKKAQHVYQQFVNAPIMQMK